MFEQILNGLELIHVIKGNRQCERVVLHVVRVVDLIVPFRGYKEKCFPTICGLALSGKENISIKTLKITKKDRFLIAKLSLFFFIILYLLLIVFA